MLPQLPFKQGCYQWSQAILEGAIGAFRLFRHDGGKSLYKSASIFFAFEDMRAAKTFLTTIQGKRTVVLALQLFGLLHTRPVHEVTYSAANILSCSSSSRCCCLSIKLSLISGLTSSSEGFCIMVVFGKDWKDKYKVILTTLRWRMDNMPASSVRRKPSSR